MTSIKMLALQFANCELGSIYYLIKVVGETL